MLLKLILIERLFRTGTILNKHCLQVDLKRLDEEQNNSELTFLIKLDSSSSFQSITEELIENAPSIKISFIDSEI